MIAARLHLWRLAVTFLGIWLTGTAGLAVAQQSVWEFTPYRIRVFLTLGSAPELSPQLAEDLAAALADRTSSVVGAAWDLTATSAPLDLQRVALADLEAITLEQLPEDSLEGDKVMLVTVRPNVSGYEVAARELDVRTRTWNAAVRLPVWQAGKLSDGIFRAVREAFAPLTEVGTVEKEKVTLRLRAGALPIRDPSVALVEPGDLFQPLFRYNDREGNPRRITTIPFTFLTVEKVVEAEVHCKLHTGVRSPLSGRRRGRVEQLALGVVPPHRPTCLKLHARTNPQEFLVGYDIYLSSEGAGPAQWLGRTDWQGKLVIKPGEEPLVNLLVRSGGEFLARLPIVPGLHEDLAAPVPNNLPKLYAEGYLKGFQEDLVDLVTRREVLLAQTRRFLEEKRLDDAQNHLERLRAMPTREELTRRLNQEAKKVAALDPLMQRKIDALFDETRKLLLQHLDPADVENLAIALREARSGKSRTGK